MRTISACTPPKSAVPVNLAVCTAFSLAIPPFAAMFLAMISSTVWAEPKTASIRMADSVTNALRMYETPWLFWRFGDVTTGMQSESNKRLVINAHGSLRHTLPFPGKPTAEPQRTRREPQENQKQILHRKGRYRHEGRKKT